MKKNSLNSFRFSDCSNFPPKKEREEIEVQSFTSSSEMATSCEKKPTGIFLMRELQLTTTPPPFLIRRPPTQPSYQKWYFSPDNSIPHLQRLFGRCACTTRFGFGEMGGKEEEPFVMHNFAFPSRRRPHKHKSQGQKKIRGKGEFIQKKKGGGRGGGLLLEPVPPLLACIVMLARIKKSTHIRRLLLSLFLTWHIWPPAKAHLAIKSRKGRMQYVNSHRHYLNMNNS